MNLSKVEKIVIMSRVVLGILAAGIFFFAYPAYKEIGKAESRLKSLETERTNIYAELEREATIDDEIKTAKTDAEKLEGSFYPDLTTYETVEAVMAHLKDSALETHGISATNISTESLKLEVYESKEIVYDLKTYSQSARGNDETEEVLLEGQFKDGNKVYTITANSLTDIVITDENEEVVEAKKYTDTMVEAYKETLCKYAAAQGSAQTVGVVTASFKVSGRYEDYLNFINYILNYERATYMDNIVIPMTTDPVADKEALYVDESGNIINGEEATKMTDVGVPCDADTPIEQDITLKFFCVEQMEEMAELKIGDTSIVVNQ